MTAPDEVSGGPGVQESALAPAAAAAQPNQPRSPMPRAKAAQPTCRLHRGVISAPWEERRARPAGGRDIPASAPTQWYMSIMHSTRS
eukprot:5198923-Pyramimonas_sp.AAC.1